MSIAHELSIRLTIRQVADLVGLTYDQVYAHVAEKGTLKAEKVLGRYFISREDFEAWNRDRRDNFRSSNPNMHIALDHCRLELWTVPVIKLPGAARTLCLSITGERIVNSVESNTPLLTNWKRLVASRVKERRGPTMWDPRDSYAITVALSFCPDYHGGNRDLDVDNFAKPIIDALAAGIFCDDDTDPQEIRRFNYNDSNFSTLLIHRLPNADQRDNEGIAVYASSKPE